MKAEFIFSVLLGVAALTGCTVGPDYQRPVVQAPAAWSGRAVGLATTNAPAAFPGWLAFDDPLLVRYLDAAAMANHDLRLAKARMREARALRRESGAGGRPQLTANAHYDNSSLSKNNERFGGPILRRGLVERETDLFQFGFDAAWEVDLFGGSRRAVEAATARLDAAAFESEQVLVSVLAEVARNYVELRGAQQRLAVVQTNLHDLGQTLRLVEAKATDGLTGELPVAQTRALLQTTRAEAPSLEAAVEVAAHRLAVLLGREPGALLAELRPARPLPRFHDPVPLGLPADLLRRRPDVQRAEREVAAATADIGVARADLFPHFYLTGSPSLQSASFTTLFEGNSLAWTIGPTLEWKALAGGRIRARIEGAKAREAAALIRYEKTVLGALTEVEDALTQYGREYARREELARALQSSERAVALARAQFNEGLTGFLTVLDAQRSRNDVAGQLIRSEMETARNLVALAKALAGGWETPKPAPPPASASPAAATHSTP